MKVTFATYPTAFAIPGGGEKQFSETLSAVRSAGVNARAFDIYDSSSYLSSDLLHLFSVTYSMELYVNLAVEQMIPYVVSPILWPGDYDEREWNRVRHVLIHAALILTNSKAESDRIRERMSLPDRDQFVEVVNAIVPEPFASCKRDVARVDPDMVLAIANIDTRKNLSRLAEACRRLKKRLCIAGQIRERGLFERLMGEYGDTIDYVGPIENAGDQHRALLESCAVFALPSACETPGIAAIEAGAAGAPLVVTAVGSTKEYFGDEAVYCDPDDVDSITGALSDALRQSPVRPDASRAVFLSFTWERTARETLTAYRRVRPDRLI
ncbi:MAG: hypothetical protein JWN07_2906 [Hyphomicrobiales bacterium]|nr:hypothetical protein [Hyphomicrobiales bacterium]